MLLVPGLKSRHTASSAQMTGQNHLGESKEGGKQSLSYLKLTEVPRQISK